MFVYRLLATVALVSLFILAACDSGSADTAGVSGRWVGKATFETDTTLDLSGDEANARITAQYETEFTFEITDDGNLLTGSLSARTLGTRTSRINAFMGGEPVILVDTLVYGDSTGTTNSFIGTYIEPTLEIDIPNGPYEANLWTFNVDGDEAELNKFIVHTHTVVYPDTDDLDDEPEEFSFSLRSDGNFSMERVGDVTGDIPDEEE